MKFFIWLIIFSGLIISCKKDNPEEINCSNQTNQIDIVKKMIAGTYDWVYTRIEYPSGGYYIITPADIGEHRKYKFESNGNFTLLFNDIVNTTGTYIIDYESKMTNNPSDSATIYILTVPGFGILPGYDQIFICTDSAMFYRPLINNKTFYKRN
jgi:hypothetical protein